MFARKDFSGGRIILALPVRFQGVSSVPKTRMSALNAKTVMLSCQMGARSASAKTNFRSRTTTDCAAIASWRTASSVIRSRIDVARDARMGSGEKKERAYDRR